MRIMIWLLIAGVADGIYRCMQAYVPKATNPAAVTLVVNGFALGISLSVLWLTHRSAPGAGVNLTFQAAGVGLIIGLFAFLTDYFGIRALTAVPVSMGAPLIIGFLFLTCACFIVHEQLKTHQPIRWDLYFGIFLIAGGSLLVSRYVP